MQNNEIKKQEYTLVSVPTDMLEEANIYGGDIILISVCKGKVILENAEKSDEFTCDGICSGCPYNGSDCDGECEDCPCIDYCDESEVF